MKVLISYVPPLDVNANHKVPAAWWSSSVFTGTALHLGSPFMKRTPSIFAVVLQGNLRFFNYFYVLASTASIQVARHPQAFQEE
jgi:hypothetical protein